MAQHQSGYPTSKYARLYRALSLAFLVNLAAYFVLPSFMAGFATYMLTLVLDFPFNEIDLTNPRVIALNAYFGFLILHCFGTVFTISLIGFLAVRQLAHLALRIIGHGVAFDVEKPKAFFALILGAVVTAYFTLGFPHAFSSGNPRVTGLPMGMHACLISFMSLAVVVVSLRCLLEPNVMNRYHAF